MKYSQTLKSRIEEIFKVLGYKVRYEKGNFQSGYCLIMDQNVLVINKFLPLESKIGYLIEVLRNLEIREGLLEPEEASFVQQLRQTTLNL